MSKTENKKVERVRATVRIDKIYVDALENIAEVRTMIKGKRVTTADVFNELFGDMLLEGSIAFNEKAKALDKLRQEYMQKQKEVLGV